MNRRCFRWFAVLFPDLYTTASLRYPTLIFICLLFLLSVPVPGQATTLSVTVTGIEGKLLQNVQARLRIRIFSEQADLSIAEIRRLHRQAGDDISSALEPYGYYHPKVVGKLEHDDAQWTASYVIDAGEPVIVSSVSINVVGDGRGRPELSDLQDRFPLQPGDVLEHRRYDKGKKELLRTARSLGLLDANYREHRIDVDRRRLTANIELVLDTGRQYRFGSVRTDQQVISDELLDRFVTFSPGDPFRRQTLQQLQRDLDRTDYFSTVTVAADTVHDNQYWIPVDIDLKPREYYNRYSVGIGYASDIRSYARLEWLNRLVNTEGHRLSSSFLVGERKSLCTVDYTVPVLDPRYNTVTSSASWNRETWDDTVTNSVSTGVAYDYNTSRHSFGLSLEALEEDYRIGDLRDTVGLLMPGVRGSLAWADDVVNTENGLRLSLEVTGGSTALLSDASFIKLRGDGKLILSPLSGWRVIARGTAGAIIVDDIDEIPPSLRFYAGGEKSIRGYRYRSLGPQDEDGNVIGGRWLLTGSVELEKRISESWRTAAFYDFGNAMDDFSVDFAHGIGFGIGMVLPFGQARIDVAYPLRDQGSSQAVFLSVGADL